MGQLQVSYRETIHSDVKETISYDKVIAGTKNHVVITLRLRPNSVKKARKSAIKVVVTKDNDLGKIRIDRLKAIENGVQTALDHGPLLNFPVINVDIELHWFETTYSTSPAVISAAASSCVTAALKNGSLCLLEPLMRLEITTPSQYGSRIASDLSARRATMGEFSERSSGVRIIEAITPLAELVNYSTALRTLSSGTANLSMEFDSYAKMSDDEQKRAFERVTGFAV